MNGSDKFRSKVECRWMVDVATKLKINSEYSAGCQPHPIPRLTKHFSSVYVPDAVRAEMGTFRPAERDARDGFELRTANRFLRDELCALKGLRPAGSAGKLAVVGESVRALAQKTVSRYTGVVPSIRVDSAPDDDDDDDGGGPTICVRVNDFVAESNGEVCRSVGRAKPAKPIVPVPVNGDGWDEITVENRGEVSVRYGWEKVEKPATEYDDLLVIGKRPMGRFYFDTRSGVLGPGQTVRTPVLFRPAAVGPCVETWIFRARVLGRPDPVALVTLPLQGCGVPESDDRASKVRIL